MSESCANCGQTIGSLETPHLWGEHVVCAACRQKLGPSSVAVEGEVIDYAVPDSLHALAIASRVSAEVPSAAAPQVTQIYVQSAPRTGMHPCTTTGLVLFLVGIPFLCLAFPLGVLMLIAGFVLMIVGGCL